MKIEDIKNFIQSAHINFLIGSGISCPYLSTLKNIEEHLTELSEKNDIEKNIVNLVRASIYCEYFCKVILPNDKGHIWDTTKYEMVLNEYQRFISLWNDIMHNRCGNLRSKQINIFSTNIDMFFEKAAEKCDIEINDGFRGSITPIFNESNFQKTVIKNSVHFQNSTELPVFNLLKMHGSINWHSLEGKIYNDYALKLLKDVNETIKPLKESSDFIEYDESLEKMLSDAIQKITDKYDQKVIDKYIQAYEQFVIINPTKRKFSETVTDVHFYELMRLFSNSLEKENSLLFVMGFSFADEHILNITCRALQTNPTLLMVIFAYDDNAYNSYQRIFGSYCNVQIVVSKQFNKINNLEEDAAIRNFDFHSLNEVFARILDLIPLKFDYGK